MLCENGYACDGGNRTLCGENELPNEARSACIPCLTCPVGEGFISACLAGVNTVCQLCEVNAVSTGGRDQCAKCPENTRPNDSKTACIPCGRCDIGYGVVSFCTVGGDTVCAPCVAGQFSPGGRSLCEWCGEGEFCPEGASSPRPCMKGSFCNVTNRAVWGTTETPCAPGESCPEGTIAPLECPAFASCSVPGA